MNNQETPEKTIYKYTRKARAEAFYTGLLTPLKTAGILSIVFILYNVTSGKSSLHNPLLFGVIFLVIFGSRYAVNLSYIVKNLFSPASFVAEITNHRIKVIYPIKSRRFKSFDLKFEEIKSYRYGTTRTGGQSNIYIISDFKGHSYSLTPEFYGLDPDQIKRELRAAHSSLVIGV